MIHVTWGAAACVSIILILSGMLIGIRVMCAIYEYCGNEKGADTGSLLHYKSTERRYMDGNKTEEPEDHES